MSYENVFKSWHPILSDYVNSVGFSMLGDRIAEERKIYKILPESKDVFRAFQECDYNKLKVIVLGQDPYPTLNTADGLCFSTRLASTPPSLIKIREALEHSNIQTFLKNDLTRWAEQGVLLLNTSLTCRLGIADSHKTIGWEHFIDYVLANVPKDTIVICFGARALDFARRSDLSYHHCNHPAYFAYKGKPMITDVFIKCNEDLARLQKQVIDWR
jgi:uracil-DNA glycosylase